jgi:riboflavin kinase/FMN adenylyltransferase
MMEIHWGIENFQKLNHAVVTSGTFDGVHLGHQKILNRLVEIAKKENGHTVLLTYWPHPRLILFPDQPFKLLSSVEDKAKVLDKMGIDHLVVIPFDQEFSQLSSSAFIHDYLVEKIGTKKLVIGFNHRFGKNREGSFTELRRDAPRYGFKVEEIPKQMIDRISISSTKIRKALESGNVEISNEYLGRPYDLHGTVIRGDQMGRKLGFPTANIRIDFEQKLIPADGIYAVWVVVEGKTYDGMANIGFRPTFAGLEKRIEAHIFDFDRDIYKREISFLFHKKLRSEIKFPNPEALKKQLKIDKQHAVEALSLL